MNPSLIISQSLSMMTVLFIWSGSLVPSHGANEKKRIQSIVPHVTLETDDDKVKQSRIGRVSEFLGASKASSSNSSGSSKPTLRKTSALKNLYLPVIEAHPGWSIRLLEQYEKLVKLANDTKGPLKEELRQEIESILFVVWMLKTAPVSLPDDSNLSDWGMINPQSFIQLKADNRWTKFAPDKIDSKAIESILAYRELLTHALISRARETMQAATTGGGGAAGAAGGETVELYGVWSGSSEPTSDIDVNLRGNRTEEAVRVLNAEFSKHFGKNLESGIVWDINFYAKDFLPEKTPEETKQVADGNDRDRIDNWRPDTEAAILKAASNGKLSKKTQAALLKLEKKDRQNELIMSLVRIRIDMDDEDWKAYTSAVSSDRKLKPLSSGFKSAEEQYATRKMTIGKIKIDKVVAEDAQAMAAENRAYEEVLVEVAELRRKYEVASGDLSTDKALLASAKAYVELRAKLSEACMYANEAYLTPASVVGVVMNKQILSRDFKDKAVKPQRRKLALSPHEHYQMMNEQYGRIFHQLDADQDNPHLASRRIGKYVHRFFNAAKQITRAADAAEHDPVIAGSGSDELRFSTAQAQSRTLEGLKKEKTIDKTSSVTKFPKIGTDAELDALTRTAVSDLFGETAVVSKSDTETPDLKAMKKVLTEWKLNLDRYYWKHFGDL